MDLEKYVITPDSCRERLQYYLRSSKVKNAEDIMILLYQPTVSLIQKLLKPFREEVIEEAIGIINDGILLKGKKEEDVRSAKSTEEVFENLDIPRKWNDISVLRDILDAVQVVDNRCYQAVTANLDHYHHHLVLYHRVKEMIRNKQSLQDAATLPGQDEVVEKITLKDSIFQLRYESCDDLWLVVLAEGAGIPRDQIKCGLALPGNRNTATLPIRDSLLTNRDLFRNTKVCHPYMVNPMYVL